jgi:pimeloyl-ACP methyl ester carboxylesterase
VAEGLRTLTVGGERFALVDRGDGPPLLLVHGFPFDHRLWAAQTEALSASHRVIAPDLRGFGGSVVTPGTVTMERHADDLAALLEVLDERRPVVLAGFSMGGYVAFAFRRRHAARLAGLVLCDTRSIADDTAGARNRHDLAARVLEQGAGVVADAMLPRLLAPDTPRRHPEVAAAARAMMESTAPEGIAAALRGMAGRPDVTPELGAIAVPTLVVCGEHDALSTPDEMVGMSASIPGARFLTVPDAGHLAPLENPAAVTAALAAFLAGPAEG